MKLAGKQNRNEEVGRIQRLENAFIHDAMWLEGIAEAPQCGLRSRTVQ
jgi:hypothetical protein